MHNYSIVEYGRSKVVLFTFVILFKKSLANLELCLKPDGLFSVLSDFFLVLQSLILEMNPVSTIMLLLVKNYGHTMKELAASVAAMLVVAL